MKNFECLVDGLDVIPLLTKLRQNPWLWKLETRRQEVPGSPQKDTEAIILRWQEHKTAEESQKEITCYDQPIFEFLGDPLVGYCAAITDRVGDFGHVGRVMLTKLGPKRTIAEHQDEGLYADHYERFHMCVASDLEPKFHCGGETVCMGPGSWWWFNHKLPHSVANFGLSDRIHLIVDLQSEEFRKKRGIYFQREGLHPFYEEAFPMFQQHWAEIAHYKELPLDPDAAAYDSLDKLGKFHCYTARDCGKLIGYAVFMVFRGLHYNVTTAQADVLFLLPEYRSAPGRIGSNLIRYAEQRLLGDYGRVLITHHSKVASDVGKVLDANGYEEVDRVHMKLLGKD